MNAIGTMRVKYSNSEVLEARSTRCMWIQPWAAWKCHVSMPWSDPKSPFSVRDPITVKHPLTRPCHIGQPLAMKLGKLGKLGTGSTVVTNMTVILVSLSLVIKLAATIWLNHQLRGLEGKEYTYVGNDYPETLPLSSHRARARIGFENTKHYELDTEQGAREWEALVPGDGVVHLGPEKEPFSVSLFQQLKCLDVLRKEIVDGKRTEVARHCLNYIKQMILCRGDVHLESFNYASHIDPIDQSGDWECRDWDVVYREVRRNQAAAAGG